MPEPSGPAPACPNGHALDPEWQVCPYCPSAGDAPAFAATLRVPSDAARAADPAMSPTLHAPRPPEVQLPPELARTVRVDRAAAPPPAPELARTLRVDAQAAPGPPAAPARKTEFLQRPPPAAGIAWLVSVAGPARGTMHRVDRDRTGIGAARDADARIDSPHVSDRHASIRCRGREWVITDLDSTNGTFVNGEPVHQQALADGDRVRFGASEWVFRTVFFDDA